MPAILTQMRGNAISPRSLRQQGRAQRVGISATPCIAQGRNMIDIDAKALLYGHKKLFPFLPQTLESSSRVRRVLRRNSAILAAN